MEGYQKVFEITIPYKSNIFISLRCIKTIQSVDVLQMFHHGRMELLIWQCDFFIIIALYMDGKPQARVVTEPEK
jgi:hypothetical protein